MCGHSRHFGHYRFGHKPSVFRSVLFGFMIFFVVSAVMHSGGLITLLLLGAGAYLLTKDRYFQDFMDERGEKAKRGTAKRKNDDFEDPYAGEYV